MKFTASILTLAAAAAANNMADMGLPPACATSCFTDLHQSPQCQIMDYKCLCGDREFVTSMARCIGGACNSGDASATRDWAEKQCEDNYGVDISGDFGEMNDVMGSKNSRNTKNAVRGMLRNSDMKDGMDGGMKAGTEGAMKMEDDMKKKKMNLNDDLEMKDTMENNM